MTHEEAIAKGWEVHKALHSMKRRTPWYDYSRKGSNMLTPVARDRMSLSGSLKGSLETTEDGRDAPYVEPSALGTAIKRG